MPKKPVLLNSDLKFESVGEAKQFYKDILNSTPANTEVDERYLEAVIALYVAYCKSSPGYDVDSLPTKIFCRPDATDRGFYRSVPTTCFYVRFENGEETDFSYIKAVQAVANF